MSEPTLTEFQPEPVRDEDVAAEATPGECRAMALREIDQAANADSVDHMILHLESALIWARGGNS